MERIELNVNDDEFAKLNKHYPKNGKSSDIAKRAIELVKLYFRSKYPNCDFSIPTDGSDLEITFANTTQRIEVKGTAATDIAWAKLKVSGEPSYKLLLNGLLLYRVCGVYKRNYTIFVLQYGSDFKMKPEPRWSIHK